MINKMILLSFTLSAVIFSSCSSDEKTIGLGQNIHHDDFEYSVQNVEKTDRIGSVKSKGMFYIVTFQVQNKARRVEHEWDNNITYLVDEKRSEYENSHEMQQSLKNIKDFSLKDKYVTPAGQTESAVLVFDIPNEVKEIYLKVRGDFLMGDMFDGNQFKNTKVKLF